jgi:hypothetical protein
MKDKAVVAETAIDNYRDFKFDRLPENSGDYEVEILPNGAQKSIRAHLRASVYVGGCTRSVSRCSSRRSCWLRALARVRQ